MSLLRLLTAGKSLVGMRDAESRYRVTSQRLLPHFGSTRNPFSNRAKAEPAKMEARPPVDHNKDDVPAEKPNLAGPSGEPVVALRGASDHRAVLARFDPRNLGMALWRRMAALLRRVAGRNCASYFRIRAARRRSRPSRGFRSRQCKGSCPWTGLKWCEMT